MPPPRLPSGRESVVVRLQRQQELDVAPDFLQPSQQKLHRLRRRDAVDRLAQHPDLAQLIRVQQQLTRYFVRLGGAFMLGDTVERADREGGRVKAVYTVNHGDIPLCADNYVLATGSFFSRGIIARPDSVYEPIFDLDVHYDADRSRWYDADMFAPQRYMTFGVLTDPGFRALCKGEILSNLYAVGSVLSGHNALHEGCGGGVSVMSAMCVAESLSTHK